MRVKDIINSIEEFAPVVYQESYDNSGLQIGDPLEEVKGVLLTLDLTEDIIREAISRKCNLIIAHHPLLFSGLKRISNDTYTERIVKETIRNNINIYAAHTNMDNMKNGVNAKIAEKLGLIDLSILAKAAGTLFKLYTYAPLEAADNVLQAMFAAGAGEIGKYKECSFNTNGVGSFKPGSNANPAIGKAGGEREQVVEAKIEVLVQKHNKKQVLRALFESHPYEEVAYELVALENANQDIGAGIVGNLPNPLSEKEFLTLLQKQMKLDCIRHTALTGKKVNKIAICGGAGSFLLKDAISAGADFFVTADFKYHQFFDADGKIVIADIGHYESEQFTIELFQEILNKKFPNFAILLSSLSTNPVKYFC
ncbi:MAG TPA: Nif3-like dinuclear metal center hexameric protein [Flavipsychrobacter sp.]|nr:Nif3-like dinuclear metal center hexameric protein [Flavipsychrobacter sp.]